MIGVIVLKTLAEWWRDKRLKWLAAGSAGLIIVVALTGLQSTVSMSLDRNTAVAQETDNFVAQGAKNPHAVAHFGQYAFRPLLLPSALDPGVSPWMGSMIWMEAHRRNLAEFRPAEDGAGYRPGGNLSVAWVLQSVLPLLMLMLGFNAIAGERERQTLVVMLAQGIPLRTIVVAKGCALLLVMLAVLLPLASIVIGGYWLASTELHTEDAAPRLVALGTSYVLYLIGFVGLVLAVSLVTRTARTALSVLLIVWMIIVVLLPRLSTDHAALQHPIPSAAEFWDQIKRGEGLGEATSPIAAERAAALRAQVTTELLQRYDVTRVEDLPVNFTAVYLQRLEEADAPIFDHVYGKLWNQQESQRTVRSTWGVLSPAVSLREVSMAIAGTDPFALKHFSEAAEQHRRELVRSLNEKQAIDGAGKGFYVAPAETWQSIPSLRYTPPDIREVLARHQQDLWLLLLWALLPILLVMTLASRTRELR